MKKKIFVLDTNVLMHDPTSLFRFEEHDLFLPMVVLEELDAGKKGTSEVSRNVRQVSRFLDELMQNRGQADIEQGLQLYPERQVTLVSKDINLRIKAAIVGVHTEDYHNDQVLEDLDLLYRGYAELGKDFWQTHGERMESWQDERGRACYRIHGPKVHDWHANQFLYLPDEIDGGLELTVQKLDGDTAELRVTRDYRQGKTPVWGIHAKNREQNFSLNLLLDPDIDFVTVLGAAGTGKTLLTLAAGLAQTLDEPRYREIIMTRVTVPLGDDIGFLPGTEEEKMTPWMGALMDNLEVLTQTSNTPQPLHHHRRSAEPHAQADEDLDHTLWSGQQDGLSRQPRPDRHPLPH